jgi:hypothetical protein
MEVKQHITLTTTKGDATFTFHIPVGTTWGNAVDAAYEILTEVGAMAKKSMEQMKPTEDAAAIEPTLVEGE